jgi:hypothetical protein
VQKVLPKEMSYERGHGIRVSKEKTPRAEQREGYAITEKKCKHSGINLQEIFTEDGDSLKQAASAEALQEVL